MKSFRMYWFLIFLSFTFRNLSEAKHQKKFPSATVVGTVHCDTCSQSHFPNTTHFISGALVAVECGAEPSFRREVKTNAHGKFKIHLPFSVAKHVEKIKECSVKLISSTEPYCSVASASSSSSSLRLMNSRKQETRIFSAGFFRFKPLKCKQVSNEKVAQQQCLTPSPLPPNPFQPPSPLPPNPFQPPPSTLHSNNPLQPPPLTLPPNPFQLSPPPPPAFIIALPPFPFQPAHGYPGIPPASSYSFSSKKTSP